MPDPHTNFDYPTIIGYWGIYYWIWSNFRCHALSLRMSRVTWPIIGGQKWSTFLKSSIQIYLLTSLSGHYAPKLSHVIAENVPFITLWRLRSSLRMRSITWPVHSGSPKITRNNFLTPNSLYNFYWATTTIKCSLYLSTPY